MPDVALQVGAIQALPLGFKVPGGQEIVLKTMRAHIDGTGAGGSFIPAVILRDAFGNEAGCYTLGQTLAAGASADVSWFPGLKAAAAGAGSGTFWPAANQAAASLDSTTYANVPDGSGNYDTLVMAGLNQAAFALANLGDAFPNSLCLSNLAGSHNGGWYFNDGSVDPYFGQSAGVGSFSAGAGVCFIQLLSNGIVVGLGGIETNNSALNLLALAGLALFPVTNRGGDGNITFYAGKGAPTIGGNNGTTAAGLTYYWRQDGGAGTRLYVCTTAGPPGVAVFTGIL